MWLPLLLQPKFTAIITSYNYKEYVGACIRGVHAQSYKNLECIIVDDASSDGSADEIRHVLRELADPRFRLIEAEKNLGQLGAMMRALKEAEGDFVGFLDADDLWASEFVRLHIEAHLNQSKSAGMSCCDMGIIGKEGQLLAGTWMPFGKPRGKQEGQMTELKPFVGPAIGATGPDCFPDSDRVYHFQQTNPAHWKFSPTSACVFRRALLTLIAPDDAEGFRISADYYLVMLASIFTGCLIIEKPVSFYRLHGSNSFSNNPVMGGNWREGKWDPSVSKKYKKLMLISINAKYELLCTIFGQWEVLEAIRKLNHEFSLDEMKSIVPLIFDHLYPWKTQKLSMLQRWTAIKRLWN
jgi:glycosyltransferase involved in cell wall biosynthesis